MTTLKNFLALTAKNFRFMRVPECFCALLLALSLVSYPAPLLAASDLKKLSDNELSQVTGKDGIAFQMDDWRATNGNVSLSFLGAASFSEDPDFANDGHITLSNIRWNDPYNFVQDNNGHFYPSIEIDQECGSNRSTDCQTLHDGNPGVNFGSFGDPMTVNVTGDKGGIIRFRFPENESNMQRVSVGGDVSMNNDFLMRAALGNAQWASGTQLELKIKDGGGVQLGLNLQLDGDIWAFTKLPPDGDNHEALSAQGVFGAGTYTGSGIGDCCSYDQFEDSLTWANIAEGRPLDVDFVGGQINLNLTASDPSAGVIGVNDIEFNEETYGSVLVKDLQLETVDLTTNL